MYTHLILTTKHCDSFRHITCIIYLKILSLLPILILLKYVIRSHSASNNYSVDHS